MEEFELFLHPPQEGERPSPDPPFCLGVLFTESAAGEQGLVGRSVCRLCLVCVHGSLQAVTSPTKERSS